MKYCQRCNLDLPDAFKFCASCGGNLAEAAEPVNSALQCPKCGEPTEPNWKFCALCQTKLSSVTISHEHQLPPPSTPTTPLTPTSLTASAVHAEPHASQPATADSQIFVRCRNCKKLVEEDATLCKHCGADMFEDTAPVSAVPPGVPSPQPFESEEMNDEETFSPGANVRGMASTRSAAYATDRATVLPEERVERIAPTLTGLESYGQRASPRQWKWWRGVIIGALLLMVFAGLAAGGRYWWSRRISVAQSPPQITSSPEVAETPSSASSSSTLAPTTSGQLATSRSADEELKQLRERRTSATPSAGSEIISAIEAAERKYPTDYRFPYEHARLFGKGIISHDEAFTAVLLAAEKAIDNGKAQEMLTDLMSDKDGDFSRLSRGHHEWKLLEEALRDGDKAALKTPRH